MSIRLPMAAFGLVVTVAHVLAVADAQQGQQGQQNSPANSSAAAQTQNQQGQPSAANAQNSNAQSPNAQGQNAQSPNARVQGQSGQPGQAQPGQAQAGRTGAHNQEVVHYIANNLLLGNQAEVELGQLAAQQAENDQVKAFGQMMVKEHQQMIQELQRVAGTRGATSKSDSPSSGATRTPSSTEPNSDAQPRRGNASGQGGVPGQGNSANPSGPIDQVVGEVQVGGVSQAETTASGQSGQAGAASSNAMTHGSGASQQIIQLCQQAAQTELQMTREMLQQYKGQDFDMGYLGQQIIAHTRMLAELRAARNAVPPELQQLIQQAEQSTEQHLEMAKKLAMKLDGDSSSGERGERGERKDRKERKSEERDNS